MDMSENTGTQNLYMSETGNEILDMSETTETETVDISERHYMSCLRRQELRQ